MDFKFKVGLMATTQELCLVANSSYMIELATLLAKSQFTHGEEAPSLILCFYKLLRQWYEEQIQNVQTPAAGNSAQSQKTAHSRKEGVLHREITSSYLKGKAVIITASFGKKTKVFGENCGW